MIKNKWFNIKENCRIWSGKQGIARKQQRNN